MFHIVIQHLYALWNGHPNTSSNHMPPYKINTILFTIFLMLYIISSWCIYFITGSLYFFHLFHPFPLGQPPGYFLYLWVCFWGFFVYFLDSTYYWNHVVFVFLWLISLSMITSGSVHVVTMTRFHSSCWIVWVCSIYALHLFYPFICPWIFKLLPYLGNCK